MEDTLDLVDQGLALLRVALPRLALEQVFDLGDRAGRVDAVLADVGLEPGGGVPAGALADLLAQSLLQLSVPSELRGRAGGAWVLAIGLAPLGQLQIGALASLFGVSFALGTSGLVLVVLASTTALLFPRVKRI